ncbi:MAG TPA: hypothetical protein VF143_00095 [Candidatus Nanopelagicales bacterium]
MQVTTPTVVLAAATDALAKVREAVPERLLEKAEHGELGAPVRSLLHAVLGEEPDVGAADSTGHEAAPAALAESAVASVAAVKEAAMSEARSGGRVLKAAVGVLLVGAAVGGGYYVWRKRQAAAEAHLTGEGAWGAPPEATTPFMAGMADTQSPDVVDEQFAAEVDAEAAQFADELVDAVELPEPQAPETAEVFEEGMAATQSPETVDEQFAAEIDAAADSLSDSIVEGIEEPKS